MEYPSSTEGVISIDGPAASECNIFILKVYNNGAFIELSDTPAERHIKSGNLIFALSKDHDIVGVYLTDLTEQQVAHIKTELNMKYNRHHKRQRFP